MLIEMLRRPEGATIAQIMAATGWQAHTCRGAFAGALKKKRGLTVTSEKTEGRAHLPHRRVTEPAMPKAPCSSASSMRSSPAAVARPWKRQPQVRHPEAAGRDRSTSCGQARSAALRQDRLRTAWPRPTTSSGGCSRKPADSHRIRTARCRRATAARRSSSRRVTASDRFEHPSKDVRTAIDAIAVNSPPIARFSPEDYLQPEQRKDDDLRQQRDGKADDDVGDRLDQRHPA